MSELMFGLSQTKKKKEVSKKVKQEKDNLWNYKGKEKNGLESYRFEQTQREANWKKTGRDQIKENTKCKC